jgi:hypothetical protein
MATLSDGERSYLQGIAGYPKQEAYLWSETLKMARRPKGENRHIDDIAMEILSSVGVAIEVYAGHIYLNGRRVYFSERDGRWHSDDWR